MGAPTSRARKYGRNSQLSTNLFCHPVRLLNRDAFRRTWEFKRSWKLANAGNKRSEFHNITRIQRINGLAYIRDADFMVGSMPSDINIDNHRTLALVNIIHSGLRLNIEANPCCACGVGALHSAC